MGSIESDCHVFYGCHCSAENLVKVQEGAGNRKIQYYMKKNKVENPIVYPLYSSGWGLCENKYDGYTPKPGDSIDQQNKKLKWVSCCCARRWEGREMIPKRLLVMGFGNFLDKNPNPEDEDSVYHPERGEPYLPTMAFLGANAAGSLPAYLEGMMNVLKIATLLSFIPGEVWHRNKDIPVHKELVVAALARSGDAGCQRLTQARNAIWIRSPELEKSPYQNVSDYLRYYSEDSRLSVQCLGVWIRALIVDNDRIPALTESELQDVLDFCCAFIDWEATIQKVTDKMNENRTSTKNKGPTKELTYARQMAEKAPKTLHDLRPPPYCPVNRSQI